MKIEINCSKHRTYLKLTNLLAIWREEQLVSPASYELVERLVE